MPGKPLSIPSPRIGTRTDRSRMRRQVASYLHDSNKEDAMAETTTIAAKVIDFLKEDHEDVKGLFEEFVSAEGKEQADIAATAIMQLEVHADLEEKLIYP